MNVSGMVMNCAVREKGSALWRVDVGSLVRSMYIIEMTSRYGMV